MPKEARDALLGHQVGAPDDQNKSRQERAANPGDFAEFLPMFAIRPLYNQTLWLVSKTGVGLVRAGVLLSVGPYFLLGILVFVWLRRYTSPAFGFTISILLMLAPPITGLGRETTADAMATLVALAALYLIFEKNRFASGITVLLVALYWYESVRACLESLYDKVVSGGIIQFDDYGYWKGARKAIEEFLAKRGIDVPLQRLDYSGRSMLKPLG